MFIMLVGEGLESYAATRTKAAIQRFVETMPHHARLLRDGIEVEVDVEDLQPGDMIAVRAGERIAADGVIAQGQSSIEESTITGEPLPRDKGPGDEVFSGTLNGNALLTIRVTRAGSDTTLARVVRLVEEAKSRKAPVVRTADRYARYFLPAILIGRRRHVLLHARLASHRLRSDRGVPVRPDPCHSRRHGCRDRRTGAPRHPGARRQRH